jgi:hypothetical protein
MYGIGTGGIQSINLFGINTRGHRCVVSAFVAVSTEKMMRIITATCRTDLLHLISHGPDAVYISSHFSRSLLFFPLTTTTLLGLIKK